MESRRSVSLSRGLFDIFIKFHLLDLIAKFLHFRIFIDLVPQFIVDGLYFFAQIVFFLLLIHLTADFAV